jgi:acetyltransferase-like isoleucine patch superfamily enzyme
MLKYALKTAFRSASLLAVLLPAAPSGFGRWTTVYELFAHVYAVAPGILGDYLRIAFYKLTLAECSLSSRVSFGSFFPHVEARIGPNVYIYIGSYCVIGKAVIGKRTQIASGVQILSGQRQHSRNEAGEISGAEHGVFTSIAIGEDCWIGAAAIIMADVGAGATIGAGSVVSRPIPPGPVAVGSPARVIKTAADRSI